MPWGNRPMSALAKSRKAPGTVSTRRYGESTPPTLATPIRPASEPVRSGQPQRPAHDTESIDQALDVLGRVVHRERGPRRGRRAQPSHEGLCAMVAGPHTNAQRAQDLADVVRMGAVQREGDKRAAIGR